jgi:hypothetical protein
MNWEEITKRQSIEIYYKFVKLFITYRIFPDPLFAEFNFVVLFPSLCFHVNVTNAENEFISDTPESTATMVGNYEANIQVLNQQCKNIVH